MYGVRGLLHDQTKKILIDNAPGIISLCDKYNMSVDVRSKCDKALVESFLKSVVELNRYTYTLKQNKTMTCRFNNIIRAAVVSPGPNLAAILPIYKFTSALLVQNIGSLDDALMTNNVIPSMMFNARNKPLIISYSLQKDLSTIIRLTENENPEDSMREIVSLLKTHVDPTTDLAIQNIMDLNIVPVNIHALMKEIPLVNLYNYAYTFDMMMMEYFYGQGLEGSNASDKINTIRHRLCDHTMNVFSAKDQLAQLLHDPHALLGDTDYMRQMMVGESNSKELGRPKFLSDQLWNKVLLYSVYLNLPTQLEPGPINFDADIIARANGIILNNIRPAILNPTVKLIGQIFQAYHDLGYGIEFDTFCDKLGVKAANGTPFTSNIMRNIPNINDTIPEMNHTIRTNITYMDSKPNRNVLINNPGTLRLNDNNSRTNTIIVRNLIFTTNLFRMVRMKLHRDLVFSRDIVLKSAQVTRPQLTEFRENEIDVSRPPYPRRI
jgi:hypothetical protein